MWNHLIGKPRGDRMAHSISVYRGRGRGQVGHGLGGLFRPLAKTVIPLAKTVVKDELAPALLSTGAGFLQDLAKKKDPKQALIDRKNQALKQGTNILKKKASSLLTSFLPGFKRSNTKKKSAPARQKKRLASVIKKTVGRNKKKTKPARKLDIFDF